MASRMRREGHEDLIIEDDAATAAYVANGLKQVATGSTMRRTSVAARPGRRSYLRRDDRRSDARRPRRLGIVKTIRARA